MRHLYLHFYHISAIHFQDINLPAFSWESYVAYIEIGSLHRLHVAMQHINQSALSCSEFTCISCICWSIL